MSALAPVRPGSPADAVEEAHRALGDDEVRHSRAGPADEAVEGGVVHGEAVEIDARRAGRRRVEGGVDVVGSALDAADLEAAAPKRPLKAERRRWSCRRPSAARRREGPGASASRGGLPRSQRRARRSRRPSRECRDRADGDHRRARRSRPSAASRGKFVEGGLHDLLRRGRRRVDGEGGCRCGKAAAQQARRRSRQVRHRHVEHDGEAGAGERRPVRGRVRRAMAGRQDDRVVRCRASSPGCRGSRAPRARSKRRGRSGTGCRPRRAPAPPRRRARTRTDRRP